LKKKMFFGRPIDRFGIRNTVDLAAFSAFGDEKILEIPGTDGIEISRRRDPRAGARWKTAIGDCFRSDLVNLALGNGPRVRLRGRSSGGGADVLRFTRSDGRLEGEHGRKTRTLAGRGKKRPQNMGSNHQRSPTPQKFALT
jgi:hypothetical protein